MGAKCQWGIFFKQASFRQRANLNENVENEVTFYSIYSHIWLNLLQMMATLQVHHNSVFFCLEKANPTEIFIHGVMED